MTNNQKDIGNGQTQVLQQTLSNGLPVNLKVVESRIALYTASTKPIVGMTQTVTQNIQLFANKETRHQDDNDINPCSLPYLSCS
ncbi:uncharacterized protein LOC132729648 isoform X1 [Ruditapes philippinarum]|uniref:uncharacterized protein LOC132729648 isoform X1 n=1 Tax=Ruditapes philippinarum TaxID=129788 RepID=UPI00295AAF3B|nr:uncharacterized protein LOC132729648 isoform X1 [Ruditapes philippinarum]